MNSDTYVDAYGFHYFPYTLPISFNNHIYAEWMPYDSASTVRARIEGTSNTGGTVATHTDCTRANGTVSGIGI